MQDAGSQAIAARPDAVGRFDSSRDSQPDRIPCCARRRLLSISRHVCVATVCCPVGAAELMPEAVCSTRAGMKPPWCEHDD